MKFGEIKNLYDNSEKKKRKVIRTGTGPSFSVVIPKKWFTNIFSENEKEIVMIKCDDYILLTKKNDLQSIKEELSIITEENLMTEKNPIEKEIE